MAVAAVRLPRALLLKSIDASDITVLKDVLTNMCQSSDELAATVSEYMLVQKGELLSSVSKTDTKNGTSKRSRDHKTGDIGSEVENADEDEDPNSSSPDQDHIEERAPKRIKPSVKYTGPNAKLISRYETCDVCEKRFDILANHSKACRTHDGEIEIDDEADAFPDDDEVHLHGIDPETDWRRESCPWEFKWTCCDGDGDADPCRISRHEARRGPKSSKRH